jgi:hypothetical protein
MDNYKFKMKTGEVGKEIEAEIKDEKGNLVDLTDKPVFFTMKKNEGGANVINLGPCVNNSDQIANKGKTRYKFLTAVAAGIYYGEFCVVDGSNIWLYPNDDKQGRDYITITVTAALAVPTT